MGNSSTDLDAADHGGTGGWSPADSSSVGHWASFAGCKGPRWGVATEMLKQPKFFKPLLIKISRGSPLGEGLVLPTSLSPQPFHLEELKLPVCVSLPGFVRREVLHPDALLVGGCERLQPTRPSSECRRPRRSRTRRFRRGLSHCLRGGSPRAPPRR